MKTNNKDKMIEEAANVLVASILMPEEFREAVRITIRKKLPTILTKHEEVVVEDFKTNVVKYALDEAKKDCLSCGMHEQTGNILERLAYWIETETRDRNKPTPDNPTSNNK